MRKNRHLAADGLLKSGLKLIGAKVGQTKQSGRMRMYACEPTGVTTYVEPFLGSGAVICGKQPHKTEIVGDINEYVINFFNCMKQQPEDLFKQIHHGVRRMEAGEAEYFHAIRKSPPQTAVTAQGVQLDWAVWYYLVNKYSFNGIVRFNEAGECNSTYCQTTKGRGIYDREWFDLVRERIRDVEFHNCGYELLLSKSNEHANPGSTWVVLDPPYYEVFTKYNRISFSQDDHARMRDLLRAGKYKWLLTINDHPEVRELYRDFNFIEHEIFYSCSQTAAGRGNNKELIVTNYDVDTCNIERLLSRALETYLSSTKESSANTAG